MEVACAVSADGRWLAVRRGAALSLHDVGDDGALEQIADTVLPHAAGALAFVGGVLILVEPDPAGTALTAFRVPTLANRQLRVEGAAPLAGASPHWLLLGGVAPRFVRVSGDAAIAADPIDAQIAWAVGLTDDRFVIASGDGAATVALWDAATGAKVGAIDGLDPTRVKAAGAITATGELWLAGSEPRATIVRISDSRARTCVLPAVASSIVGHPASRWIAIDAGGAGFAVELDSGAHAPLADGVLARAILPAHVGARVVEIDAAGALLSWRVERTTGGGAASRPDGGEAVWGLGPRPAAPPSTSPPPPPPTTRASDEQLRAHPLTASPPERVVLRPDAVLGLAGADPREPAHIARHVAPERAAALAIIADAVRAAWLDELRLAYLTGAGAAAARIRVTRRMIETARAHAAAIPGARVEDDGRIALPTPLATALVQAPWNALVFAIDRAQPQPFPTGASLAALALDDGTLAHVGRLLGLLTAGVGPVEVAQLAIASPDAKHAWGRLVALDLLAPAATRPALADVAAPGHVATLGRRTLLANLGGHHVIVDPVLIPRSRLDRAPLAIAADLPVLGAIVLSSADPDSLDIPTLLALDKRVPVFLPPESFAPRCARLCADLGFGSITHVVPRQSIELDGGGRIVPIAVPGRRASIAYALVDRRGGGAALAAAGVVLDASAQLAIATALHQLATPSSRISPLFFDLPKQPRAVCERGWAWLVEPAARWTVPEPDAPPSLDTLARAARARQIVAFGEGAAPSGTEIPVIAATSGASFPIG